MVRNIVLSNGTVPMQIEAEKNRSTKSAIGSQVEAIK